MDERRDRSPPILLMGPRMGKVLLRGESARDPAVQPRAVLAQRVVDAAPDRQADDPGEGRDRKEVPDEVEDRARIVGTRSADSDVRKPTTSRSCVACRRGGDGRGPAARLSGSSRAPPTTRR